MNWKLILQWIGACIIVGLFFLLLFYLGKLYGETKCLGKPDSSKSEIPIILKDTAETIRLQALNKSLSAENAKLKMQIKQIITHVPQKLNQNEKNIYYAISHGDSVKMLVSDSLLRAAGYK